MAEPINRRTLLKRTALGAAGLAVVAVPGTALGAATKHRKTAYRLHPRNKGCSKRTMRRRKKGKRRGCSCNACLRHARFNVFPTAKAADGGRAHKYCDCRIVKIKVSRSLYIAMFGHTKKKKLKYYGIDLRSTRWKKIRNARRSSSRALAASMVLE